MAILESAVLDETAKRAAAKQRMINLMRNMLSMFRSNYTIIFNMLWNNPLGVPPEEILEEFGTDAKEFFTLALKAYAFINDVSPDPLVLNAPREYVLHDDNTVTLAPLPPTTPPAPTDSEATPA